MNASTAIRPVTSRKQAGALLIGIGLVVLLGIVIATLPPLRRWIANPTGQAAVATTSVLVRGDRFQNHVFDPPVIRVPVGSTVTWTFADRGAQGIGELDEHNVVGNGFVSPVLTDGTWSHTFDRPGTYRYLCTLHAYMDGQIEVVAQY
jgi:plastocyanin